MQTIPFVIFGSGFEPDVTVKYEFKNIEIRDFGNKEAIIPRWVEPIAEYNFGQLLLTLNDWNALKTIHDEAYGTFKQFLYKDPANHKTTYEPYVIEVGVHTQGLLIPVDSDRKVFRAVKSFCVGDICGYKTIYRFIPGTVGVAKDGDAIDFNTNPFTVDNENATITFTNSQPANSEYTLDCEFYTIVRFTSDRLEATQVTYDTYKDPNQAESDMGYEQYLYALNNLVVREVVLPSVEVYQDKDFSAASCSDYKFNPSFIPEVTEVPERATKIFDSETNQEKRESWDLILRSEHNLGGSVIYDNERAYLQAYFFSKKGTLLPFKVDRKFFAGQRDNETFDSGYYRFGENFLTLALSNRNNEGEPIWEMQGIPLVKFTSSLTSGTRPVKHLAYKDFAGVWRGIEGENLTYTLDLESTREIPYQCDRVYNGAIFMSTVRGGWKQGGRKPTTYPFAPAQNAAGFVFAPGKFVDRANLNPPVLDPERFGQYLVDYQIDPPYPDGYRIPITVVGYNGEQRTTEIIWTSRPGATQPSSDWNLGNELRLKFKIKVETTHLGDNYYRFKVWRGFSNNHDPNDPLDAPGNVLLEEFDVPFRIDINTASFETEIYMNGGAKDFVNVLNIDENVYTDISVLTDKAGEYFNVWVEWFPYPSQLQDDCYKIDIYRFIVYDRGVEVLNTTYENNVPVIVPSYGRDCVTYLAPPDPGTCQSITNNMLGFHLKVEKIYTFDHDLVKMGLQNPEGEPAKLLWVRQAWRNIRYEGLPLELDNSRWHVVANGNYHVRHKLDYMGYLWSNYFYSVPPTFDKLYGYGNAGTGGFMAENTIYRYSNYNPAHLPNANWTVSEVSSAAFNSGALGVFNFPTFTQYIGTEVWEVPPNPFATILERDDPNALYIEEPYFMRYTLTILDRDEVVLNQVSIDFNPSPGECAKLSVLPLAYCVKIVNKNGDALGFTSHQADITLEGITYKALSAIEPTAVSSKVNLSTDNLDVRAFIDDDGITTEDLRAGLYDNAKITLFLVNFLDVKPNLSDNIILLDGYAGDLKFNDSVYTMELRSKSNVLNQQVSKKTSILCPYDFGDSNCRYNLAGNGLLFNTQVIDANPSNRREVRCSQNLGHDFFDIGTVTFTTGANKGYTYKIASATNGGVITLSETMQYPIANGDQFTVKAGCPKTVGACRDTLNNYINFGGFPSEGNFMPGLDKVIGGSTEKEGDSNKPKRTANTWDNPEYKNGKDPATKKGGIFLIDESPPD